MRTFTSFVGTTIFVRRSWKRMMLQLILFLVSFLEQLAIAVVMCEPVGAVNNPKKSGLTLNETFLGLLYPAENYKV